MSDKLSEVEGLVKELKGAVEAEIHQIEEKFEAYEREVGGRADEARLNDLAGELRDTLARVKGIVADEPAPSASAETAEETGSTSEPASSDSTDLGTDAPDTGVDTTLGADTDTETDVNS